jgi:hypothetical protein
MGKPGREDPPSKIGVSPLFGHLFWHDFRQKTIKTRKNMKKSKRAKGRFTRGFWGVPLFLVIFGGF